jgi:nucleoid-associated protein YgaU
VLYGFDGPAWSSETRTDEAPAPPPPPRPAVKTYTVVSSDTWWAISERFYGDGNRYQQITDASGVSNPDLIHPGQVLTIP